VASVNKGKELRRDTRSIEKDKFILTEKQNVDSFFDQNNFRRSNILPHEFDDSDEMVKKNVAQSTGLNFIVYWKT